jgi:hypothetical protein
LAALSNKGLGEVINLGSNFEIDDWIFLYCR